MTKNIIKFFRRDRLVKLIVLLVAVGLWAYVGVSQAKSGNFPGALKIKIKNAPNGTSVTLNENYAELKIEADRTLWARLQPSSFDVFVDASKLTPGTHELEVQASSLVSNIRIVGITPKTVLATVESVSSLELPIAVKVEGKPANNYVVGEHNTVPGRAVVSAPSDILLDNITVSARVVLNGESQTFNKVVQLDALDKDGQSIPSAKVEINPQQVTVRVEIVPSGQTKTVGVKPVMEGVVGDGYYVSSITANPPAVIIDGPPDVVGSLTNIPTDKINLSGLTADKTFTVNLVLPSSVSANPRQVQVTVAVAPVTP
ncbi:MAG TPA: CdaR family protein [Patescibacteria group bacterium]|nr:CdaR family protein [Patescibacteria group bacterium]